MISDLDRPRLLFSYVSPTSFVRDDRTLLEKYYDVRAFHFDAEKNASATGLAQLWMRQLQWLLRELPKADLVYGWFADHHAVLPVTLGRWFGVPTAIVLGGMDCNRLPEYDYGVWESRWRAPLVRWIVRRADLLPTVSRSLIEAEECYSNWPERRRNGIRVHVPDLQTPHPVVPLGFRPDDWPMGPPQRPDTVTTVALVESWRTFKVKGLDLFLAAARRMPEVSFRIVGVNPAFATEVRADKDVPENVELVPPRPRPALTDVYQETAVYAQLSRVEAFGLVVGEAMLSGCVPVVSAVGQPPELVGETGEIVQRPDPGDIADALRRALDRGAEARTAARSRIETHFSMAQRRERLLGLLKELRQ
jgi:glycosyltransferase involved in cell wall biosynthesis